MFSAIFFNTKLRKVILAAAFLQFPVHLYMMIALRTANQGWLGGSGENSAQSENSEDKWDFGQTASVLLLGVSVNEFLSKGWEFYKSERELRAKKVVDCRNQNSDQNEDSSQDQGAISTMEAGVIEKGNEK